MPFIIDAPPDKVFAFLRTGKVPEDVHHNVKALTDLKILGTNTTTRLQPIKNALSKININVANAFGAAKKKGWKTTAVDVAKTEKKMEEVIKHKEEMATTGQTTGISAQSMTAEEPVLTPGEGETEVPASEPLSITHKHNMFLLRLEKIVQSSTETSANSFHIALDLYDNDKQIYSTRRDSFKAGYDVIKIKGCKIIISSATYNRSSVEIVFRSKFVNGGSGTQYVKENSMGSSGGYNSDNSDNSTGSSNLSSTSAFGNGGNSTAKTTPVQTPVQENKESGRFRPIKISNSLSSSGAVGAAISSRVGVMLNRSQSSGRLFGNREDANRKNLDSVSKNIRGLCASRQRHDESVQTESPHPPPLLGMEQLIIDDLRKTEQNLNSKWSYAPHSMSDTLRFSFASDGEDNHWGRAEGLIHTNIEEAISFLGCFELVERRRYDGADAKLPRLALPMPDSRLQVTYECIKLPPPQRIRRVETWTTWEQTASESGARTFLFAYKPVDSLPGYDPPKCDEMEEIEPYTVLARSEGLYRLEELGNNMTKIVMVQKLDLGSSRNVVNVFQHYTQADKYLKKYLDRARHLQAYFIKPWKDADWIMNEHIAMKVQSRKGKSLEDEDQKQLMAECLAIGKKEGGGGTLWTEVAKNGSSSPFVDVYVTKDQSPNPLSTNIYKAIVTLDTDIVRAAAWFINYCSLQRMMRGQQQKELARLMIDHPSKENESILAKIIDMPSPFGKREFVETRIWKHDSKDTVYLAWKYIDQKTSSLGDIDYGVSYKAIRAKHMGFYKITPLKNGRCSVELRQSTNFGGYLRDWSSLSTKRFGALQDAKDFFDRSLELDADMQRSFVEIANSPTNYCAEEETIIQRGLDFYTSMMETGRKQPIHTEDPEVEMGIVKSATSGDGEIAGYGTTIVDAPLFRCLADEWLSVQGYETMKHYYKAGGLKKIRWPFNEHHELMLNRRNFSSMLDSREFRIRRIWRQLADGRIIMYTEDSDEVKHEKVPGCVLACIKYVIIFEQMSPLGGVERTRVSTVGLANIRGLISVFQGTDILVKFVSFLSDQRKKFHQSWDIDAFHRKQTVTMIKSLPPSPKSMATILFKDLTSLTQKKSAKTGWGVSSAEVDSHFYDVAAYFWNFNSRNLIQTSGDDTREIHHSDELGTQFSYRRMTLHGHTTGHRLRDFFSKMTIHRINENTLIICIVPTNPEQVINYSRHNTKTTVIAEETTVIKIERKSRNKSRVNFAVQLNLGGHVGKRTLKTCAARLYEDQLIECQNYFLHAIPAVKLSPSGGQALVHLFFSESDRKNIDQRVTRVFAKSVSMRELKKEYPWVTEMFKACITGKLRPLKKVNIPPHSVQSHEGAFIGTSLAICLATARDHISGVDEWIMQYEALAHLDRQYEFFRPMLETLAKRVIGEVGWGVKMRVFVVAAISIMDMLSDFSMILVYISEGRENYAITMIIFFAITMALHCLITIMQNNGVGWEYTLRQILLALSGFKPGFEAYRVGTAAEILPGQILKPEMEMVASRVVELFSENIPATFIQLSAIMTSDTPSSIAVVSLLSTLLSAGLVSAQISFDYDVEPLGRQEQPRYYGFLKDDTRGRLYTFLLMMLLSAGQLITRCFAFVLLSRVGSIAAIVFLGELVLFLLYKMYNDDLIMMIPFEGGKTFTSYTISLLWRIISKCVVDFTCCVQFRHCNELGGAWFSLTYLLNLVLLTFSVFCCASMILIALLFLRSIKPEYVHTFFDRNSGWKNNVQRFDEAATDLEKFSCTISYNTYRWRSIRNEVKSWVQNNWFTWQNDRPKWLTNHMLERIPVDWIPLYEQENERAKRRRKSTLARRNSSVIEFINHRGGGGGKGGNRKATGRGSREAGSKLGRKTKVVPAQAVAPAGGS
ncbi:hypothetical protein TL16_g12024 [Triparma laevis f. inornata]|uniref:Uncharacterized protein n=1 Tax=Triparma laevis f. inornata TaxID=1714386 RepID=A0A9W7BJ19_9STRA|nr:hypothetical protein TL16_g12024 [Triparma laevis f. inornata]